VLHKKNNYARCHYATLHNRVLHKKNNYARCHYATLHKLCVRYENNYANKFKDQIYKESLPKKFGQA
jgi:hypothetical protein